MDNKKTEPKAPIDPSFVKTDSKCPKCNEVLRVNDWSPMGIDKICPKCGYVEKVKFNGQG